MSKLLIPFLHAILENVNSNLHLAEVSSLDSMTITIGKWLFQGPYLSPDSLEDRSGVYAILDQRRDGNYVIDVGESKAVKTRVESHDRVNCWTKNQMGTLAVAVFYTPQQQQAGRTAIEQELRSQYNPVCGIR